MTVEQVAKRLCILFEYFTHPEFPKSVYVDNSTNRIVYSAITDISDYTFYQI